MLHRVHWHRVLLDEAHQEKGAAKVVAQLAIRSIWCITGGQSGCAAATPPVAQ